MANQPPINPYSTATFLLRHPYARYAGDRRIPSCLRELRLAPDDTQWAKNGKYEYCHNFSNSKILLKLPAFTDFKRHKVPNRRGKGVGYIKSQPIGLKYFPNDMVLTKQQYSYLPFFAHRVRMKPALYASGYPHDRKSWLSRAVARFDIDRKPLAE